MSTILTLQIADVGGRRGLIIAATADPKMLQSFRAHVLEQRWIRLQQESNPLARRVLELDYERLKRVLDSVLPKEGSEDAS